MQKNAATDRKIDWQPLRVLALKTPYTMEYLSLMARRKELKVKKVGRLWYSTLDSIREFEKEMQARKEKKREKMRAKYFRKTEKQPTRIRVSQAAIFDQIQSELEEVLQEIREKEQRLRDDYRQGIARVPFRVAAKVNEPPKATGSKINLKKNKSKQDYLRREKQETEDISEKLILDLGKLLNTANQIQEDAEKSHQGIEEQGEERREAKEEYQIPVRNKYGHFAEPSEHHAPFLSLNYPEGRYQGRISESGVFPEQKRSEAAPYEAPRKKTGWLGKIMILVISFLVFIAILFILFLVLGN